MKRRYDSNGSLSEYGIFPKGECHCATCTCDPNMTPAVRFDLSPAQMEGAIRDHLIRLGWTPPEQRVEIESLRAEMERLLEGIDELAEALSAYQAAVNKIDEVVFIDGVGAARSSIKSCRDGVQWIRVGDRVYWPLSDSDAKRLHSACCGNGSFDGPATPLTEDNVMNKSIPEAVVEAVARAKEEGK